MYEGSVSKLCKNLPSKNSFRSGTSSATKFYIKLLHFSLYPPPQPTEGTSSESLKRWYDPRVKSSTERCFRPRGPFSRSKEHENLDFHHGFFPHLSKWMETLCTGTLAPSACVGWYSGFKGALGSPETNGRKNEKCKQDWSENTMIKNKVYSFRKLHMIAQIAWQVASTSSVAFSLLSARCKPRCMNVWMFHCHLNVCWDWFRSSVLLEAWRAANERRECSTAQQSHGDNSISCLHLCTTSTWPASVVFCWRSPDVKWWHPWPERNQHADWLKGP